MRLKLALDIAQGMCYLHDKQQLAHLDLKSPNVLLKGKDAKLADFGTLRRLRGGDAPAKALSGGGGAVGGVGGTGEAQASAMRQAIAAGHAEGAGTVLEAMGVPAPAARQAAAAIHSGSAGGSGSGSGGGQCPGTPEWLAPELLDVPHQQSSASAPANHACLLCLRGVVLVVVAM